MVSDTMSNGLVGGRVEDGVVVDAEADPIAGRTTALPMTSPMSALPQLHAA